MKLKISYLFNPDLISAELSKRIKGDYAFRPGYASISISRVRGNHSLFSILALSPKVERKFLFPLHLDKVRVSLIKCLNIYAHLFIGCLSIQCSIWFL